MIPLCDRRSACWLLLSSLAPPQPQQQRQSLPPQQQYPPLLKDPPAESNAVLLANLVDGTATSELSMEVLARFICQYTPPPVLEAIRDSGGHFLYRGQEDPQSCYFDKTILASTADSGPLVARVCDPPPDLLLAETYGNPLALQYFRALEGFLSSVVDSSAATTTTATPLTAIAKPSNGHIATSDPSEAGKWGRVVSIWPIVPLEATSANNNNNNSKTVAARQPPKAVFSYVWPSQQAVFYDLDESKSPKQKQTNGYSNQDFDFNVLVANQRLQDALEAHDGREVLFSFLGGETNNHNHSNDNDDDNYAAFLAIPAELDEALRKELETIGYGL